MLLAFSRDKWYRKGSKNVLPSCVLMRFLSPRKRPYIFQSLNKLPVKVPVSFSDALGRDGKPMVNDSRIISHSSWDEMHVLPILLDPILRITLRVYVIIYWAEPGFRLGFCRVVGMHFCAAHCTLTDNLTVTLYQSLREDCWNLQW